MIYWWYIDAMTLSTTSITFMSVRLPNMMSHQTRIPLHQSGRFPLRWRDGSGSRFSPDEELRTLWALNLILQWKEHVPIIGVFGFTTNGLPSAIWSEGDTPLDVRRNRLSLLGISIQFGGKSCSRQSINVTSKICDFCLCHSLLNVK